MDAEIGDLVAMGFSRAAVHWAMEETGNDLEEALELLLATPDASGPEGSGPEEGQQPSSGTEEGGHRQQFFRRLCGGLPRRFASEERC